MSDLKIKVIAVELNTAKTKTGKDYQFVECTYKNLSFGDKTETKKHNQYGDKTVFNVLKDAKPGDVITIQRKKDDAGYWQWVGVGEGGNDDPVAKSSSTSSAANPAPKSNWETADERAKKQVYIIKQSSLSTAVAALKTDKKPLSADEVIDFARVLESYIFGINLDSDAVQNLPTLEEDEDIPL